KFGRICRDRSCEFRLIRRFEKFLTEGLVMKMLLVHGVGHCESVTDYYNAWKVAIERHLTERGFAGVIEFDGLLYDELFDEHNHSAGVYAAAVAELVGATVIHSIFDPIGNLFHKSRDFGDDLRWKAGMVAQLTCESALRTDLRNLLAKKIADMQPD